MIGIILSLGALNALIPLLVIIILIGAAGMLMRGFSFFNLFGLDTLFGLGGSSRSASITGKSMTTHVIGPKSISVKLGVSKRLGKTVSTTLKEKFPGYVSSMAKATTPPWKWKEMTNKESKYYDPATAALAERKKFLQDSWEAVARGKNAPPISTTIGELNRSFPDQTSWEARRELEAAAIASAGYAVDITKIHQSKGVISQGFLNYGNIKKAKLTKKEFLKGSEEEIKKQTAMEGGSSGKAQSRIKSEQIWHSLQQLGLLEAAQRYGNRQQAEFEGKVVKLAKDAKTALDRQKSIMHMSQKDYDAKLRQIQKQFQKRASRFYHQVNDRRLSPVEFASAQLAIGKASGYAIRGASRYAIKGDEDKFRKHMQYAFEKMAPGVRYKGGRIYASTNPSQLQGSTNLNLLLLQGKKPLEASEGTDPNQLKPEEKLLLYKEREEEKAARRKREKEERDKKDKKNQENTKKDQENKS